MPRKRFGYFTNIVTKNIPQRNKPGNEKFQYTHQFLQEQVKDGPLSGHRFETGRLARSVASEFDARVFFVENICTPCEKASGKTPSASCQKVTYYSTKAHQNMKGKALFLKNIKRVDSHFQAAAKKTTAWRS